MADGRRIYWDACVWIGLLNEHPERVVNCREVIRLARAGDVQIWTSSIAIVEVFKVRRAPEEQEAEALRDVAFEDYVQQQDFVVEVQVDHDIAIAARRLLRAYPVLRKPNDAIHLATALRYDCAELHTYNGENLLGLNGRTQRAPTDSPW